MAIRMANPVQLHGSKPDGSPFCDGGPSAKLRKAILKDACIDKPINSHILRHTTAMWLKIEGVSIQVAANFLGCSTEVLEKHYVDWDMVSLFSAIDALTGGQKQKSGLKRMRALGLSPMGKVPR